MYKERGPRSLGNGNKAFSLNKIFRKKMYRLTLGNNIIEIIKDTKLFGTVLTDDLQWSKNTKALVKLGYARRGGSPPPLRKCTKVYSTDEAAGQLFCRTTRSY